MAYTEGESMGATEEYEEYVKRMCEFYIGKIPTRNPQYFIKLHHKFDCDKYGNPLPVHPNHPESTKQPYIIYNPVRSYATTSGYYDNEYKHQYTRGYVEQEGRCMAMKQAVIALNKLGDTIYEYDEQTYHPYDDPTDDNMALGCWVIRKDDIFTLMKQKINKGVSTFKQF